MNEFTKAEIDRINKLYGNDFADITPDDVLLIARFERVKALQEAEYQAKVDAIKAENETKLKESTMYYQKAMENLETIKQAALSRLERVENVI